MSKKLICTLVVALAAVLEPRSSLAQTVNTDPVEDTIDDEAPPKPEYPYPGADEQGVTPAPKARVRPAPKPLKVDDDGNYYYGTELEETRATRSYTEQPKKTTKTGEFNYDTKNQPLPVPSGRSGQEAPISTAVSGEYNYPIERSPLTAAASMRFGILGPPSIRNTQVNPEIKYTDIYSDNPVPVILGDYEWRLTSSVGRFSLKFTSGLFISTGNGRFRNPQVEATDDAEEQFTFVVLPHQLTANYKFQYAENQIIVPYVEGGAGYFTFAELRDDNKKPKFGASPVAVGAGGFNFLIDGLDRRAVRSLDNDYGINHVWLTTELRLIIGLNDEFDFSSQMANAGFLVEF